MSKKEVLLVAAIEQQRENSRNVSGEFALVVLLTCLAFLITLAVQGAIKP